MHASLNLELCLRMNRTANWFFQGMGVSSLIHSAAFGLLYFFLVYRHTSVMQMDLDLSQAPLVPAVANHKGRTVASKTWTAPKQGIAAMPSKVTESAEEDTVVACPPPCPNTPGDFIPAGLTNRQP